MASWTAHLGSVYILAVKLIAMPLIAIGVSRCFGLPPLYASIALIFAALPTASSAFILAQRMGYDGTSVAWLISASTLLAMISLPLWLGLT
jgi:predicted permease